MWTDSTGPGNARRRNMPRLVAGLLLAASMPVCALSTDREQPIDIVADRAEHDDAKRVTIYRGNVVIDQGSLHITGDTVTIHFDEHDDVAKMIAVGVPAHFRQLSDGEAGHRKAWAKRMEYFPGHDLIVLLGEARYEKQGSEINADRLVYDSLNARFKALTDVARSPEESGGAAGGNTPERVRITLQPKKKPEQ